MDFNKTDEEIKKMSDDEIERILRGDDDDDSNIEIEDKDSPRQIRHRR